MSEQLAKYATRDVPEEKPVKAWDCCWADKHSLSEYKPGQPFKNVRGYLPLQVIPWNTSELAVGLFNLWGKLRERQPQSGLIKWDVVEREPYYIAQFGYPRWLWVFDPELAAPLRNAFSLSGCPDVSYRYECDVKSVEWLDLVLRPGFGNPAGAITEDVTPGWQPTKSLHIRWQGLWLWRRPTVVRRVRWDDAGPVDPQLVHYGLQGVADIGQAGQRPVLVYTPFENPADKEGQLRQATKNLQR